MHMTILASMHAAMRRHMDRIRRLICSCGSVRHSSWRHLKGRRHQISSMSVSYRLDNDCLVPPPTGNLCRCASLRRRSQRWRRTVRRSWLAVFTLGPSLPRLPLTLSVAVWGYWRCLLEWIHGRLRHEWQLWTLILASSMSRSRPCSVRRGRGIADEWRAKE